MENRCIARLHLEVAVQRFFFVHPPAVTGIVFLSDRVSPGKTISCTVTVRQAALTAMRYKYRLFMQIYLSVSAPKREIYTFLSLGRRKTSF